MNEVLVKFPSLATQLSLHKLANAEDAEPGVIDQVSNWFAENPRWGRAALYGGGAFLGTGLLSALLGSKNSLAWAVPAALIAGAYGHQKEEADKIGKDTYNKVSGWVTEALDKAKGASNNAK